MHNYVESCRQMTEVRTSVDINASIEEVFAAFTDWAAQGEWMVGTTVEVTKGDGRSVGSELSAFTGVHLGFKIGFLDTMTITDWQEPYRVDVLHTGRVVKGTGVMEVVALAGGQSRFLWSEDLDLPLGALGRLGWPLVRPAFVAGVNHSLKQLGRYIERQSDQKA